jgi:hypothetical protein
MVRRPFVASRGGFSRLGSPVPECPLHRTIKTRQPLVVESVNTFLEKRGEFVRVGADLARHLQRARHYALTERVCYFPMDFSSGSFNIFYARHVE